MELEYNEGAYCLFAGAYAKVYTLSDEKGNVFYVGCTTQSVPNRLSQHITAARSGIQNNIEKNAIIKSLDYKVRAQIVDMIWVTSRRSKDLIHKAKEFERNWIIRFHQMGYNLCNKGVLKNIYGLPKTINVEKVGQIFESTDKGNNVVVIKEALSEVKETVK